MRLTKRAIVVGGSGNLGKWIVDALRTKWEVTSIDFAANEFAKANILLSDSDTYTTHAELCSKQLEKKYDAIICAKDSCSPGSIFEEDIFEKVEEMLRTNLSPSVLTGHIASKHLEDGGFLLFTGGLLPFKDSLTEYLPFCLAKNTVHMLALNMAKRESLPSDVIVASVLPSFVENTDCSVTNPKELASIIKDWANGSRRPDNGSFASFKMVDGKLIPEYI